MSQEWSRLSRTRHARAGSLGMAIRRVLAALCALSLLCVPAIARAAPSDPADEARLDLTVRFLQEAQNQDGGFGGEPGAESNQDFSAWVALALAAAGINPQDQAKPEGQSVYTYLTEHAAQAIRKEICGAVICTTSFERELLVADASCTSPSDYGGIDLLEEILARRLPDGSFPVEPGGQGEVNDTIFAVLALSPIKEQAVQEAVKQAAEWVISQQNADGSWFWKSKGFAGEADMTGAAIEALNAAGMPNTEAQQKAIGYLHKVQRSDGGFPEFATEEESNSGSTAWATQGIWAAGENPEASSWVQPSSGHGPLDYLESMQQPDGRIRYRASEELNGIWMTAYSGPAYAGQTLPYPCVPRNPPPPKTTSTEASGQGGEAPQTGSGVIAGGGGNGAPLFSRPQPRSKGHTPGGASQLKKSKHAPRPHRRNPGRPRKRTAPTTTGRDLAKRGDRLSAASAQASGAAGGGSGPGAGSAGAGAGGGGSGDGGAALPGANAAQPGQKTAGTEVKGVLIGSPKVASRDDELEAGAPGLHSAGAGSDQGQWLAIATGAVIALLVLAGAMIEHRRPQRVL